MTKINKVEFHKSFVYGKSNEPAFVDMPFMSSEALSRLFAWFLAIKKGKKLEGLNKPSWIGATGAIIPGTQFYQANNIWHYHSGPYVDQGGPPAAFTTGLTANAEGKTSAEVYHYAKNEDTVIVLGYSPSHIPFPLAADPLNPLAARGSSLTDAVDISAMVPKK